MTESRSTRDYYATFDDALRAYAIPLENHALVRATVATLDFARIYIPAKTRPYIALEAEGGSVVAYVNSGCIDIPIGGGLYKKVELPTNRLGSASGGGTKNHPSEEQRPPCPLCFTELPASGVCGTCD
ncbi:hypothetical protein [Demequina mangrovi]|uniref:Uncharacterized protein n=1 Tax=Demequina mangrovi TaxID=1043493 RepID=A0A1H6ZPT2_9MICO|nr:hypothetical protein [Demequina mangrovi]SEJ51702.1 hypothetical protein SAMN05421637_2105 [Demequina mangrovi]